MGISEYRVHKHTVYPGQRSNRPTDLDARPCILDYLDMIYHLTSCCWHNAVRPSGVQALIGPHEAELPCTTWADQSASDRMWILVHHEAGHATTTSCTIKGGTRLSSSRGCRHKNGDHKYLHSSGVVLQLLVQFLLCPVVTVNMRLDMSTERDKRDGLGASFGCNLDALPRRLEQPSPYVHAPVN